MSALGHSRRTNARVLLAMSAALQRFESANVRFGSFASDQRSRPSGYVRFSNRPFRVKRFQTIHDSGVNVARGLALLSGLGTGPSIMGFEDEVEQSFGRPCRQCDCRFKRTYELTSSIVPRGTSFHRSVELECP